MKPVGSVDDVDAAPVTTLDIDINHGFGPIPEKRKKRAALLSAGLSFIIMIVLLGCFTKLKPKLYVVNKNGTERQMTCKRNEEYYHVGIFIWSLNLIGIILGEVINRFCLVFEEYFHLETRYNGNKKKMFSACFNDISGRVVLFGTLVAFIVLSSTLVSQGADYFKLEHIEIILSGVGSGSLVLYLLSLDTLSRVQISALLENNNRLVANGLAWSFYLGYLRVILPVVQTRIECSKWKNILSSRKHYILVPRGCYAFASLSHEDKNIEIVPGAVVEYETERPGTGKAVYRIFVYKINRKGGDSPLYVLAEYATPLCSLHDMSHAAKAKLSVEDRDEQAKLFVRTLEAILERPSVPEVRNQCRLVPYARNPGVLLSEVLAEVVLEDMNDVTSYSSEISLDDLDGVNQDN